MRARQLGPDPRVRVAVVTVALALSLLAPGSLAAASPAAAVRATGSVTCGSVTGRITYRPALHHVGTTPDSVSITLRATRCATTRSNVTRVTSGTLTQSIHLTTNSCQSALSVVSGTVRGSGTWSAPTRRLKPTSATFSGVAFVRRPNGAFGMVLPEPAGTASATGSFAGTDHGARTSAVAYSSLTSAQVLRACTSSAGLAVLSVTSGRLTVG